MTSISILEVYEKKHKYLDYEGTHGQTNELIEIFNKRPKASLKLILFTPVKMTGLMREAQYLFFPSTTVYATRKKPFTYLTFVIADLATVVFRIFFKIFGTSLKKENDPVYAFTKINDRKFNFDTARIFCRMIEKDANGKPTQFFDVAGRYNFIYSSFIRVRRIYIKNTKDKIN
ncbi:MAG: hypothetical protein A3F40_03940 [Chlamydiae bacterium RIFCSPHIGHO2_12_FULL_27_8]|nr:MAG: hypothetical protein A3F40_03940 [Chlamydiae bacterium RIFCSPHIGHO2_12_FULL_27_8]